MATNKHRLPVYLDEIEMEKLRIFTAKWGCSMSSAIKRLIRECKEDGG
jgi:hypothetical protein